MTAALVLTLTLTTTPGLLQFSLRVHDYVETHRRLAAAIEQPLCSDAEELTRQTVTLAAAIRDARPRAKEGDIFTIAAGEAFRTRIAAMVRRTGFDVAAYLARHRAEREELDVHVFGSLPWRTHVALMPIMGIPLPLVSYGGTAVMTMFMGVGLALSVRMRRFVN